MIALIAAAEKPWPQNASVIAFRSDTPCTYISASAASGAFPGALVALEQLGRKPALAILRYAQFQLATSRDQYP